MQATAVVAAHTIRAIQSVLLSFKVQPLCSMETSFSICGNVEWSSRCVRSGVARRSVLPSAAGCPVVRAVGERVANFAEEDNFYGLMDA